MRVLLVEDDKRICEFIVKGLKEKGYFISLAETGDQARQLIALDNWDVIIMDIMLPDIDGIQLTKMIRHKKNYTPIIILSALSEAEDKVNALDSGADDYLTKPFHFNELISRINALARRKKLSYEDENQVLKCHDLYIDMEKHKVKRANREIELSPREFNLLIFLTENKNKVVTRTQILNAVWGINFNSYTNVVDVYISYLRNKIDDNENVKIIQTVKGRGYMMVEN